MHRDMFLCLLNKICLSKVLANERRCYISNIFSHWLRHCCDIRQKMGPSYNQFHLVIVIICGQPFICRLIYYSDKAGPLTATACTVTKWTPYRPWPSIMMQYMMAYLLYGGNWFILMVVSTGMYKVIMISRDILHWIASFEEWIRTGTCRNA